jgi:hypothetical protein
MFTAERSQMQQPGPVTITQRPRIDRSNRDGSAGTGSRPSRSPASTSRNSSRRALPEMISDKSGSDCTCTPRGSSLSRISRRRRRLAAGIASNPRRICRFSISAGNSAESNTLMPLMRLPCKGRLSLVDRSPSRVAGVAFDDRPSVLKAALAGRCQFVAFSYPVHSCKKYQGSAIGGGCRHLSGTTSRPPIRIIIRMLVLPAFRTWIASGRSSRCHGASQIATDAGLNDPRFQYLELRAHEPAHRRRRPRDITRFSFTIGGSRAQAPEMVAVTPRPPEPL